MKLKDLKDVLHSQTGNIQFAIVWDYNTMKDLENGCSVDYAVAEYGKRELKQITATDDKLILTVK